MIIYLKLHVIYGLIICN